MSDLFPEPPKPNAAPTKALCTLWDARLEKLGLPKLTDGECKKYGAVFRSAMTKTRGDPEPLRVAINTYFDHPDEWAMRRGFPILHWMTLFRGLLLTAMREKERKMNDLKRQMADLERLKTDDDPTVAIERVKEDVARFRKLARGIGGEK